MSWDKAVNSERRRIWKMEERRPLLWDIVWIRLAEPKAVHKVSTYPLAPADPAGVYRARLEEIREPGIYGLHFVNIATDLYLDRWPVEWSRELPEEWRKLVSDGG